MNRRTCAAPDRDEPGLRCGYPLPCPHHTLRLLGVHELDEWMHRFEARRRPLPPGRAVSWRRGTWSRG